MYTSFVKWHKTIRMVYNYQDSSTVKSVEARPSNKNLLVKVILDVGHLSALSRNLLWFSKKQTEVAGRIHFRSPNDIYSYLFECDISGDIRV